MLIIAVDDENLALESLIKIIKKIKPDAEVHGFTKPYEAIKFIEENKKICDVAFLDIEMRHMNGLELAKKLQNMNNSINIIVTMGYSEYLGEAFKIHASGYIMKPITLELVQSELNNLRRPISNSQKKLLKVQCFGNFEVFSNDKPLKFARSKTKELFAYLVDRRGASLNTKQLCAVLWENKLDSPKLHNQFRNLVFDLHSTLREVNAEDVLITNHNSFAIDISKIECDYYLFCGGKYTLNRPPEYMAQYNWTLKKN